MGTHPIFESGFDCLTEKKMTDLEKIFLNLSQNGHWTSVGFIVLIISNVLKLNLEKNHHYNVKFSIPTRQKPIPLATASVFFCLTESKVANPDAPIGVEYQVEGHHLNQSPGKLEFRQKWLYDVLKSKNIFSTELIRF